MTYETDARLSCLDLSFKNLKTIPNNIPSNIKRLILNDNDISKIDNLPDGLECLDISNNKISKIENLPDGLEHLDIRFNKISKLENLPDGLSSIRLFECNPITEEDCHIDDTNYHMFCELHICHDDYDEVYDSDYNNDDLKYDRQCDYLDSR
jgi:hypothetical protein